MRRTSGLLLTALLILAICSPSAHAQTGEKSGLQVDLGLGFTSGQKIEEDLGLGEIDESTGGTLRFGLTYKLPLMKNFYLNPTFQLSFFTEEYDFGGLLVNADNQQLHLETISAKTTQINFGVNPVYYFMPATAKFRPYAGLGIKLNLNSFGEADVKFREGDTTIEGADSKTSLALGPMVGFDYNLNDKMAIPFILQYDLLFAENMGNVFLVSTGIAFFF